MATITFDQAGLTPPGITDRSRSDGLIDGSKVTITLDEAGKVTFVDVPEGDLSSVSSLTEETPLVWSFSPTAGVYGSWLVEFEPLAAGDSVRRVFAIRTPEKGLRIPAFNERASSSATIENGASFVDVSDDNEGGSYRGWARALAELFRIVASGLTKTAPSQVLATATASAGVATDAARSDHIHSIGSGTPVALTVGGPNVLGTSAFLARNDHKHALPAFGTTAGTFAEGNDARIVTPILHAARHQDGGADEISVSGLSGLLADPQTASKVLESGGPTSVAVAAIPASGIMRRNTASQVVGGPALMDNSGNISAAGTYNGINLTSAVAPSALAVGSVQAAGTATTISRSDHVHATPGLATTSVDGFMPAVAVTKLAGIPADADATLTALSTASTDIAVNSKKITGLADPTNAQDACTKAYADAVTQGLDVKTSCRVIATSNITLSGTQTIDGVVVQVGNRVLCAGQTTAATNGIYIVAAGAWTRSTDADTSADVTSGIFTFVVEGTSNADSGWVLITVDPIVLGTTPLAFTQFSGAGQIQAGTGLTKTGNTLNVGANADGSIVVTSDDVRVGVISDTQHGTRGGGTQHAAVTTSVDGFMLAADKVKLNGIADNAAALTVAGTPTQISVVTAAFGSGTVAARNDHLHGVATATPISLAVGGANAPGTATTLVRSDHVHGIPAFGSVVGTFCEGSDLRLTNARIPLAHKASHQSGGADEINVAGLSGKLKDPQTADQLRFGGTVSLVDVPPTAGQVLTATNTDQAGWTYPVTNHAVNGFRVAFSPTEPIPRVSGANTTALYLAPFRGNYIGLYYASQARWVLCKLTSQLGIALPGGPWRAYDVFAYTTDGVNIQLELSQWQNEGLRGAAADIAWQDGVLVKSSSPSRRWLASCRANGNNVSWAPISGVDGAASQIGLYNADNRVLIPAQWVMGTTNWTISPTNQWIRWRNSGYPGFEVMTGYAPTADAVDVSVSATVNFTGSSIVMLTAAADDVITGLHPHSTGTNGTSITAVGRTVFQPATGLHIWSAMAYSTNNVASIDGGNGVISDLKSGLTALISC